MANWFPMESVWRVQDREVQVLANQVRAVVSAGVRERRERPVCSGSLMHGVGI